nr:putative nucleotidyltransferase, ribonuclease H [Tanacetum cinerariifolium]
MVTTHNNPNDNVPNFEAMINAVVANALPNLMAAFRTQITNDIKNGAGPSGGGGGDAIPHGKTGATHSIVSTTFAKKLNMTPTPLIERIIISTPIKNHTLIDHEYVNCPLRFDDRIRPVNLLPIHMFGFDVILGMDWLAFHRATIDCYARTVIFEWIQAPRIKTYQAESDQKDKMRHATDDNGIPSKEIHERHRERAITAEEVPDDRKPLQYNGISMDFITGLPAIQKRHDAIWVVVDRLTKSAHFLPIWKNYSIKRTIQTLEDMLRACAFEWTGNWDEYLCSVEFAYNNSECLIEGPELIEITNEKVAVAKEKLKEARSRQKSYADKHRRDLEFQVGDRVFLKVSPFRGVKRFGIKGKLSPRFISAFEILERIGEVSYCLALPLRLSHVHDVFHVSLLRGYHYHPLHVASYPFDQIQPDMSLSEEPESILDRQERVMRNKTIPFVKILWKNHPEREATWETEESMRASYPRFFSILKI